MSSSYYNKSSRGTKRLLWIATAAACIVLLLWQVISRYVWITIGIGVGVELEIGFGGFGVCWPRYMPACTVQFIKMPLALSPRTVPNLYNGSLFIPFWFAAAAIGFVLWRTWSGAWGALPTNVCLICSYSRVGLAPRSVCPECGTDCLETVLERQVAPR